jgi:hypothetical protein
MPTYTFYILSTSVFSYNGGTDAFDFDAGYDYATGRYRIVVNDDDPVMNATGDGNQTAMIYDMDDNLIDSGLITVPNYAELADPGGGTFFIDRIEVDGVHYGYLPSEDLTPGTSYPVVDVSSASVDHTYFESSSVPCFGPDTCIDTPDGPRRVTSLLVGDLVTTFDNGQQPVLWICARRVSLVDALQHPHLRPIAYQTDTDRVTLSRQHRIFMQGPMLDLMGYDDGAFLTAGQASAPYIPKTQISWHHFLLPRHEIVRANGIWVESLFAGPALDEVLTPDQALAATSALGDIVHQKTARPSLKAFEADIALSDLLSNASKRNKRVAQGPRAA